MKTTANKTNNSLQSGKGKGAPATAPPRQTGRQSGRRGVMGPVTILKRQDVDAGTTASEHGCLLVGTAYALSLEPPAPTMPTPREDSQAEKPPLKSGKTQNNPGTTTVRQRGRGAPAVLFRKREDTRGELIRRELMNLKVHSSRHDAELARLTHAKLRYRIGVLQQQNTCLKMELARSAELSSVPTVDKRCERRRRS